MPKRGRQRGAGDPVRAFARELGASGKQEEIFVLLVQGKSRKQVAAILDCRPGTIDEHVRRLCHKARNRGVTNEACPRFDDVVRALLYSTLKSKSS